MNMQKYGDVFLCRVNGADVTVPLQILYFLKVAATILLCT